MSSPPAPGRSVDKQAVASASTSGIPDAALAAYQRAETVINAADKSCNISWQLIAAIGRVESDHGRVNGNTLDDEGLATPGIYGIPLDGTHNTAVIRDTDAGQYDDDARWDRAVGPMQFIPSTWSVVGVDGDNDGKRNPQDIDDAALATAVYLCSGNDDLSTETGRRPAIFRYNHSHRLRRPRAVAHGRLPRRRLHLGPQRDRRLRRHLRPRARARPPGAPDSGPATRGPAGPPRRATSRPSSSTRPARRPGPTAAARARSTPRS